MDYLFLFTKFLDDTGCLCLKISPSGDLLVPPEQRNFDEIRALQKECSTYIVESTSSASMHELELPWIPDRKARVAIPYALEDKVAQPVEELHFAFDKVWYYDNHYLITVISKQRIRTLMNALQEQEIGYDVITLDWFALLPHQQCINGSDLLVNNEDYKGVLSGELALSYLEKHPLNPPLVFTNSELKVNATLPVSPDSSYTWIAQKLSKTKPLNLCQGEMLPNSNSGGLKKGYLIASVLCGIWLLSLIIVNAISLHLINKKIDIIDKKIAVIYHEFFPEAKQVISPKFRISKLLGETNSNGQTRFWVLLNQFAKTISDSKITVEQLRFQNNTLSVTVVSADFASLEIFENNLRKLQIKVKQAQAATRDQHVIATLELI
jgi:general secretion pathway protein L